MMPRETTGRTGINIDETRTNTEQDIDVGTILPEGGYTTNTSASKLQTDCKRQHMNSLQCIQDNYETKDVACQKYFDLYKECRKNEHAAILEKNKQSVARSSGYFW